MNVTAFGIAQRFVGLKEVPGAVSNPAILAMLQLDGDWPKDDSVPWCSAFVNYVAWLLQLPRSHSLAARSWLSVGMDVPLAQAKRGDIVVLERDGGGHVGFFSEQVAGEVYLLGGNQHDAVNITAFPIGRILGVRRIEG